MNLDRSTRIVSETKVRMLDRVSAGTHFHSRFLDISKQVGECVPANLPQWAKHYLRGYADALLEPLHRQTDFRYLIDGQWINARDLEYANDCQSPDTCAHSGHVAATRNPPQATFWKGTDRVFYQSIEHVLGIA